MSTEVTTAPNVAWKEGTLAKREKGIIRSTWKDKFVILLEGSVFFYQSHLDLTPKGVIHLQNVTVIPDVPEKKFKRKFVMCLKTASDEIYFSTKDDEERNQWTDAIQKNLKKAPSPPPDKEFVKKTKSTTVYMSGKLIDTLSNMGASGKFMKDYVSADTETIMETVKTFMIAYMGIEKANKIEKQVISIVVKVALLYKEKQVTKEYFESTVVPLRLLISKLIDGYEIPFAFSVHECIDAARAVQKSFEKIMRPYMHEKTLAKMALLFDTMCNEDLLQDFFAKRKYRECEVLGLTLRKIWDTGAI